ncbi:MAG: hypothetical protein ACPGF7_09385 [Pontibacterium sp.]
MDHEQAKMLGMQTYIGMTCGNGHAPVRYVEDRSCVECRRSTRHNGRAEAAHRRELCSVIEMKLDEKRLNDELKEVWE